MAFLFILSDLLKQLNLDIKRFILNRFIVVVSKRMFLFMPNSNKIIWKFFYIHALVFYFCKDYDNVRDKLIYKADLDN